ncbi:MAG: flagellar basal body P-ring protein FlgI [Chromatiales bacterium]|nr:flagellar basal body P-ring protein FlgI [Chromatiales bacterium]
MVWWWGLDGTGDQTTQAPFSTQSLKNMLNQLGVTMPDGVNPQTKNMAAVMITADLPPFAKPGQRMDITVSSLGNAKSLRGGTLLMTPLKGADGQVYAIAQGNLTVGGFGAGGADGSRITVNVPSVGRVPNGATVEREVPTSFAQGDHLTLNLRRPDFTTCLSHGRCHQLPASALTIAQSLDGSSVQVRAPRDPSQRVAFVSMLENLTLEAAEPPARVVINARTGTVVMGAGVTVRPAAISHGNLTVTISENPAVSQPGALAGGQTAVVPQTDVDHRAGSRIACSCSSPARRSATSSKPSTRSGRRPAISVAILEALREAGALRAELVVI